MGSFISKTMLNLFLRSAKIAYIAYIDKCNINTKSWIKFANLKASLSGAVEKKDIKQFPHKNTHLKVDNICGFDFIVHENHDLRNEISAGLHDMIFGDAIHIINSEQFSDLGYEFIENNAVAMKLAQKQFKDCLPTFQTNWKDWNSENTLKLLLFYGLGQYYMEIVIDNKNGLSNMPLNGPPNGLLSKPSNAVYMVDFSNWEKYEVRPNFERYGGTSYFDADLNFIGFVYKNQLVKNGDPQFSHVNLIFRSTLITSITLREHLIMTHWIAANGLLISSLKYLSRSHILRRFLRSFTYGTAAINHASTIALAPFKGIAGRTFGFSKKGWEQMLNDQIFSIKYESISERFTKSGLPEHFKDSMPFYKDGMELWNINKQYVQGLIDIYYPDENSLLADKEICEYWEGLKKYFFTNSFDIGQLNKNNLINHLTYSIFMVTAGHSFFGSICEYLLTPDALMPKILKETKNISVVAGDVQTYLQALCIISMTSTPMPKLINNWEYLFDNVILKSNKLKYNLMLQNMRSWQAKLEDLSKVVDNLNKMRPIEFNFFNPKILDCSVSV